MPRIDAHQHFWKFDPVRDTWIGDDMYVLRRDFLPHHLSPMLKAGGMDGCIVVQVDQSPEENAFQLAYAAEHPFIKGVVGWVDLQADDIADQLALYHRNPLLKGFRHILQGEAQRDFMLRPAFLNGISQLSRYGFTYDILIYPDQLPFARDLVRRFPNQPFVLDHLGKPDIKNGRGGGAEAPGSGAGTPGNGTGSPGGPGNGAGTPGNGTGSPGGPGNGAGTPGSLAVWRKEIRELAAAENVYCKVSGMVTEAAWLNWKKADFRPYLDTIVEAFGIKRLLFGSDWPVCLLSGTYAEMAAIVGEYFEVFSATERAAFFGGNAAAFYHID
jgi:L-fuconolactonase